MCNAQPTALWWLNIGRMIWGVAGQRNKSYKNPNKGKYVGEVKGKFDIEWV